ncbi:MAG: VCBS domain-containing protein, partial [Mycolicibacterium sp.]
TGTVTGSDADNDTLTYSTPATTAKGSVTIDADTGAFTYTPTDTARRNAATTGADSSLTTDTITVTVDDGHGGTATVPVTVTIAPSNTPPTGVGTAGAPNATTGVVTGTVTGSDADGDTLTYSTPATTAKGSVTIGASTGAFTYTPTDTARHNAATTGADSSLTTDTITVTVDDGKGGTATVPVTVTIAPANTAPTGIATAGTPNATTAAVNGSVTGSDADSDTLTYSTLTQPTGGTVSVDPNTGAFIYTPNVASSHPLAAGGTGSGLQTISLSNPSLVTQGTFTRPGATGTYNYVAVTFTPTSTASYSFGQTSAPVDTFMYLYSGAFNPASPNTNLLTSSNDASTAQHTAAGATVSAGGCGGTGKCPQVTRNLTAGQPVTIVITTYTAGTALGLPQTFYSTRPGRIATALTTDSFTVDVSDGHGGTTTVPVTVTVGPSNAAPTAVAAVGTQSATTGLTTGTLEATDADGDVVVYSAPTTTANGGTVTIDPVTGAFSYAPPPSAIAHQYSANGATPPLTQDSFTITVQDGFGGVATVPITVQISPLNTAPTASVEVTSFPNGNFDNGLTGWVVINSRVKMDGTSIVAGWSTPIDPTAAPDGGVEATSLGANTYTATITNGRLVLSSQLSDVNGTGAASATGGVVHGPVAVSKDPIAIRAGDVVQFDWEASGGLDLNRWDAFDVLGYMLNVDTGETHIMLNETGATAATIQPVTTVNFTVPTTGNYKFVFASGSWDATRGHKSGAILSIDNVKILSTHSPTGAGKIIAIDADGDTLTYSAPATTPKGSVSIDSTTGAFTYTPTDTARQIAEADGASADDLIDTFTVTVDDGHGGTTVLSVTVPVINPPTSFIADFNFASVTSTSGSTDPTPPPSVPGATFSSFTATGVSTNPNASARFSFTSQPVGATHGSNTFTGSLNTTKYFEVTITPLPGTSLDLDTIQFTIQRSGTGIRSYAVRSSLDGFSANLPAVNNTGNPDLAVIGGNSFQWVRDSNTAAEDGSVVTLGPAFAGLTAPVTFRFYGWNAEAGTGTFSIDNVKFSGSTLSTVV